MKSLCLPKSIASNAFLSVLVCLFTALTVCVAPAIGLAQNPVVLELEKQHLQPSSSQRLQISPPAAQPSFNTVAGQQKPILVPSPLSQWQNRPNQYNIAHVLQKSKTTRSVILEVRALSFTSGDEIPLSKHFKPGTFEVTTGSSPSTQPFATVQSSPPIHSIKVSKNPSPTKLAASIRSIQVSKPMALAKMSQEGMSDLVKRTRGLRGVNLTQMPTVTSYPGQTASISDAASRPFVVGVKPQIDGKAISMQPVIQTIEDGITLLTKANIKDDKIELMADIALSQVTAVKTYSLPQFAGKTEGVGVSIQIPEVTRDALHLATTLENNETLFVDGMLTRKEAVRTKANRFSKTKTENVEKRIFLMITARIVDQQSKTATNNAVSLNH